MYALSESNCSCISNLTYFRKDCVKNLYDTETNLTKCIAGYLKEFRKNLRDEKCRNYCPLECDSMSYSITPYLELIPSVGNISSLRKSLNSLTQFETYEQVNKVYGSIYAYYKQKKYTLIKQKAKMEPFDFTSSIGGISGLFLGVSFLSLIELFEILIETICILFRNN